MCQEIQHTNTPARTLGKDVDVIPPKFAATDCDGMDRAHNSPLVRDIECLPRALRMLSFLYVSIFRSAG